MSSTLYETVTSTAHSFLRNYTDAVHHQDMTLLSRHNTPTCERHLAPASVVTSLVKHGMRPGHVLSNSRYEDLMKGMCATLDGVEVEVLQMTVDERQRKACVQALHKCKVKGGDVFELEFMWTLFMDEEGGRIVKVVEFVDSMVAMGSLGGMEEMAGVNLVEGK